MRVRGLFLTASLAGAVLLAGCNAKPENSPVIRKKFAEMDQMKSDVDQMQVSLTSISADIRVMTDQLSEMRALNPDSPGSSEIINRLNTLEERLKSSEDNAQKLVAAASVQKASAPAPAPAANTSPAPAKAAEPAPAAKPRAEVAKASTQPKAAPKPQPKSGAALSPKQASGKSTASATSYHKVASGDTLAAISRRYNVSVADIMKANRLPEGAKLLQGQTLYIPKR
ncbi:MAG: LysM domain-containing protein [Candidatus Sumerlaeia bacterium]|nr:LysM domain-containing protein [Candidatus Sumerlaeia bacterium]